jgi:uroporphyrin-III C-methyltransferase/precorrin-2 dehydrogenase/sirohydrochlorin ferrochelatase
MAKRGDKHSLAVTLRLADRAVILVGEGPAAEAQRRLLERAGARIVAEGSRAAVAFVIDDAAAVSRLKVRGILVCAVGQPDLSDFILTRDVEPEPEPEPEPPVTPAPAPSVQPSSAFAPGRSNRRPVTAFLFRPVAAIGRLIRPRRRDERISLDKVLAKGGPLDMPAAATDTDSDAAPAPLT